MKKPQPDKELPHWTISRIKGSRSEEIGIVRAKDAAGAIAAIVEQKGLTDQFYIKRLVARQA